MKLRWLGHAAFKIDDLVIDPFIKGNPMCPVKVGDIRCKIIGVTHSHHDHLGDAIEIAKNNNATIVGIHEMSVYAEQNGAKSFGMNYGAYSEVEGWKVKLVPALHTSDIGNPSGFIFEKDGVKIYHAGDTGLFLDMELIGKDEIDYALLPIGGRYVMDVDAAVEACNLIKPKNVIPMHYNTWDLIKADPEDFKRKVKSNCILMKPGEEIGI